MTCDDRHLGACLQVHIPAVNSALVDTCQPAMHVMCHTWSEVDCSAELALAIHVV